MEGTKADTMQLATAAQVVTVICTLDQAHLMGGKELTEHLLSALVMTDMTAEIEGQSRMTGSILCGAIGMTHLLSVH